MKMQLDVLLKLLCVANLIRANLAVLAFTDPKPLGDVRLAANVGDQISAVSLLRGTVVSFVDAEADSGMGHDIALDLARQATYMSVADPANLAEYCAGEPTEQEQSSEMKEGTKVEANWEGYGTMYPGKVTKKNDDGTVDIKYDDGFTEKGVPADKIKIEKTQEEVTSTKEKGGKKPRNDPACEMLDFLEKIQEQINKIKMALKEWLAGQRAKLAGEDMPQRPPLAAAPSAAPPAGSAPAAAAPASAEKSDELENLKAQLADLDAYIAELEAKEVELDEKIAEKTAPPPGGIAGLTTVDQLIAEYKAKIAEREARVKELLDSIAKKQAELEYLSHGHGMNLEDIEKDVDEVEKDLAEGKKKRDELDKAGDLDPELRHVLDSIIKALSKLRSKVDNLVDLEKKAEEEERLAEEEAKAAREAAKKKAMEEGKSEEEAEAEAKAAEHKAKDKARSAQMATIHAAKDVEADLDEAEKGAEKLDTGLHPHGDKWWRYRYEHSHIEAIIMIFISILFLLWSEYWRHMKTYVHNASLPVGVLPKTAFEDFFEEAHGTILVNWLVYLSDQMLVSIFVFLTIWVLTKLGWAGIFVLVIKPHPDMRVPHTVGEYEHLMVDIFTIFVMAIAFYFLLMFAVAHAIRHITAELEVIEIPESQRSSGRAGRRDSASQALSHFSAVSHHAMGSITCDAETFAKVRGHFTEHIQQQMVMREDADLKEISQMMGGDFNNFPVAVYLKMTVRMNGVQLFLFSWTMWLPNIALFLCLLLLHRFAHLGYIRIMGVASAIVLVLIITMGYATKTFVSRIVDNEQHDVEPTIAKKKNFHEIHNTELIFLGVMEFALFFVCYGISRMICQPWMWELHFWPVLCLTIAAIISAALFVILVAPAIPNFLCVMALPPYVDSQNVMLMKQVAAESAKTDKKQ